MSSGDDEEMIDAFLADGADESFGICVAEASEPECGLDADRGEHLVERLVEAPCEFGIPARMRNRKCRPNLSSLAAKLRAT